MRTKYKRIHIIFFNIVYIIINYIEEDNMNTFVFILSSKIRYIYEDMIFYCILYFIWWCTVIEIYHAYSFAPSTVLDFFSHQYIYIYTIYIDLKKAINFILRGLFHLGKMSNDVQTEPFFSAYFRVHLLPIRDVNKGVVTSLSCNRLLGYKQQAV